MKINVFVKLNGAYMVSFKYESISHCNKGRCRNDFIIKKQCQIWYDMIWSLAPLSITQWSELQVDMKQNLLPGMNAKDMSGDWEDDGSNWWAVKSEINWDICSWVKELGTEETKVVSLETPGKSLLSWAQWADLFTLSLLFGLALKHLSKLWPQTLQLVQKNLDLLPFSAMPNIVPYALPYALELWFCHLGEELEDWECLLNGAAKAVESTPRVKLVLHSLCFSCCRINL